jgi:4-diphosphocytidyl-2-C-methyl-D-erythritol kinase
MITARAFAKINLDLRILGVHADGYHELRTTFQSLALHDVLTFAPARGRLVVETDDPACPAHGNIVERAASALWRAAGRSGSPAGLRVRIDKRIPIAAGLGGGSADAAAALRAIARLWRISLTGKELQTIAASLGADVPFFLEGGTARGRGRGDRLTPLADPPRRWVVVASPPFGVPTAHAYRWFDQGVDERARKGPAHRRLNDLQAPVIARHPEIGALVDQLTRARASLAAMSGSGSAAFGLFARRQDAEAAADALVGGGRRVILTRTVSRREHQRLSRPVLARK